MIFARSKMKAGMTPLNPEKKARDEGATDNKEKIDAGPTLANQQTIPPPFGITEIHGMRDEHAHDSGASQNIQPRIAFSHGDALTCQAGFAPPRILASPDTRIQAQRWRRDARSPACGIEF